MMTFLRIVGGTALLLVGSAMAANGLFTVTTWPKVFRWDLQEWSLIGAGLAIAAAGTLVVRG